MYSVVRAGNRLDIAATAEVVPECTLLSSGSRYIQMFGRFNLPRFRFLQLVAPHTWFGDSSYCVFAGLVFVPMHAQVGRNGKPE
jgi:hypothetical protein